MRDLSEIQKKCEEYWPVSVGESVQPGHGLTITLTSTLPFAEYSLRKMTLTCVSKPHSMPIQVVYSVLNDDPLVGNYLYAYH
jgi:hypothetical protein